MIARISVSPTAITESIEREPKRRLNVVHLEIAEVLAAHGLLVFGCDGDQGEFRAALSELERVAPTAYKGWETVITSLQNKRRVRQEEPPAEVAIDQLRSLEELREHWTGRIAVAVVDDERATFLGVDEDEVSHRDNVASIDVARTDGAWRCDTFQGFRELRDIACARARTSRDDAWTSYIEPLARQSTRISIFDRYAVKGLVQRVRDPRAGQYPMTAVGWLLQKIDALPTTGVEVEIFSGDDAARVNRQDEQWDLDAARDAILQAWGGTPGAAAIAKIELYVATWNDSDTLRRNGHDRHISFDIGCGLELPAGFDRFDRETLEADVSINYRWLPEPMMKLRGAEKAVKQVRPQRHVTIA